MTAPRSQRVCRVFDAEYRRAPWAVLCSWDLRNVIASGGHTALTSHPERHLLEKLKCWPLIEPYTNTFLYTHDELEARWVTYLLTKD